MQEFAATCRNLQLAREQRKLFPQEALVRLGNDFADENAEDDLFKNFFGDILFPHGGLHIDFELCASGFYRRRAVHNGQLRQRRILLGRDFDNRARVIFYRLVSLFAFFNLRCDDGKEDYAFRFASAV